MTPHDGLIPKSYFSESADLKPEPCKNSLRGGGAGFRTQSRDGLFFDQWSQALLHGPPLGADAVCTLSSRTRCARRIAWSARSSHRSSSPKSYSFRSSGGRGGEGGRTDAVRTGPLSPSLLA